MPFLVYLWIAIVGSDGSPLLSGDGYYYVSTGISLWQDQDLDLENQLPGELYEHSTQVSLDQRGRFVPKHPILMPLVSLPFVMLGQERGVLVFSLVTLLLILICLYRLALGFASPWAAAIAVATTGLATILPYFVWKYSGDPISVLSVLIALLFLQSAEGRPSDAEQGGSWLCLAGVFMGLAVLAKMTMLLAVVATWVLLPSGYRSKVRYGAGVLIPLSMLGVYNSYLFGNPLTSSYSRMAVFADGQWVTQSHAPYFVQPLLEGLLGQMTSHHAGLLWTSPATVLSYLVLVFLWRRQRQLALFSIIVGIGLYLFFAKYSLWEASHHGNRFLMLPIALGAMPLAAALQAIFDHRALEPGVEVAPS